MSDRAAIKSMRSKQPSGLLITGLLMLVLLLIALPPVASVCLTYLTLTRRWFQGDRLRPWTAWVASISYQWYLWHPLVLIGFHWAALHAVSAGVGSVSMYVDRSAEHPLIHSLVSSSVMPGEPNSPVRAASW